MFKGNLFVILRETIYITKRFAATLFVFASLISLNIFGQGKLPESSIKTIYITPTSHYDLGFVEPPDLIRERAARHIDEVIRVAESNPDFRWTIESVWQVQEWLKRQKKPSSVLPADKQKIARLMNLIKSGQIALSTSWGSMHTDFMGAEELNRLCYGYSALNQTYGVESHLAVMDDVPGHPTTIPSILAGSGTKYLVTGANLFLNDATSLAPGKVPFYWESPDGSRVLTWISGGKRGGYVEGLTDFYLDPYTLDPYTDKTPFDMFNPEMAGKKTDLEVMEIGVTELLNRYHKAGYKFDAVMAMYAHDFIDPTDVLNLLKAVELWNGKHNEVKLKVATPNDFLKYIDGKYGDKLETYRGEWSGLWSEAKTRSPKISALARHAQNNWPAVESLWSGLAITRRVPAPTGNFAKINELLFGYDEHSGAGNNGWPQLNSLQPLEEQNREYVRDMKAATDEVDKLMDTGVGLLAQPTRFDNVTTVTPNRHSIVVYNGLSWNRTDVVRLAPPAPDTKIVDVKNASNGQSLVFDTDTDGHAVFIAKDVPAFGYSSFEIMTAPGKPVANVINISATATANSRYSVKLRPDGNVESVRDLNANREIVNNKGERPFNDLLRVEGSSASVVVYPIAPKMTVQRGKVFSTITVRRERSIFPLTTITIYNDLERVEIHNELDPQYEGFVTGNGIWGESYYFAFPFNISKDGLDVLRGGQKWFDHLPKDYLPGARKDSLTTQQLIGMTDGKATALLAHRQAFHWAYAGYVPIKPTTKGAPAVFPAMYTGQFPLPEATIYSRALRNASEADTHDKGVVYMDTVEPGLGGNYIFDYALSSAGVFDPVQAWRLGSDFNVPFFARYTQVAPVEKDRGFFSIDQRNVQIVDVKTLSDNVIHGEVSASPLNPPINKVFVIRLQEFSGKATTVKINMPAKVLSAASLSLTEDKVLKNIAQIAPLTVELKPYETATIKFEIE
ncbi:MAG: glycosyl hydrolase-related protein [Acidobacteriota bacterium]